MCDKISIMISIMSSTLITIDWYLQFRFDVLFHTMWGPGTGREQTEQLFIRQLVRIGHGILRALGTPPGIAFLVPATPAIRCPVAPSAGGGGPGGAGGQAQGSGRVLGYGPGSVPARVGEASRYVVLRYTAGYEIDFRDVPQPHNETWLP